MASDNGQESCSPATRMKRRQSDARWRANVASCFETLKHVIPMNKRATKRQISKAYVLREASQHINFLQDMLKKILVEKGHVKGEVDPATYSEQQYQAVKQAFVAKHSDKDKATSTNSSPSQTSDLKKRRNSATKGKNPEMKSNYHRMKVQQVQKKSPAVKKAVKDDSIQADCGAFDTDEHVPTLNEGASTKKPLSKAVRKQSQTRETGPVATIKPMFNKFIVKQGVPSSKENEENADPGIVIHMPYSRLRVNKTNVTKKKPLKIKITPRNTDPLQLNVSPTESDWNVNLPMNGSSTPKHQSCPYADDLNAVGSDNLFSDSCSNISESSESFMLRNYITPVKYEDGRSGGFTPVHLPNYPAGLLENWEEKEDDLDSAASLICDEDLPVSDGEEDFIETSRSRDGRLKRDIFNFVLPKRKRCDTDSTVSSGLHRFSPAGDLKCRRSLEWHDLVVRDDASICTEDITANLSGSENTVTLTGDCSLSDDLQDLDIIPMNLLTDPVEKIEEYILGPDAALSDQARPSDCDQLFSVFNEKYNSHISQLDSLQRELLNLEEDPSGSMPVGTISNGCDVDLYY